MAAAARGRALCAQHALEQREQARGAGERDSGCGEDGAERQREGHGRVVVRGPGAWASLLPKGAFEGSRAGPCCCSGSFGAANGNATRCRR